MKTINPIQQRMEQYRKFHVASRALTMANIAKSAAKKGKKDKKGKK